MKAGQALTMSRLNYNNFARRLGREKVSTLTVDQLLRLKVIRVSESSDTLTLRYELTEATK